MAIKDVIYVTYNHRFDHKVNHWKTVFFKAIKANCILVRLRNYLSRYTFDQRGDLIHMFAFTKTTLPVPFMRV